MESIKRLVTERFTLTGSISSKKNSRINTVRNGRVLSFPNKSYTQKLKGFIQEIQTQWVGKPIDVPCIISFEFYTPHDSWSKELLNTGKITNFKGADIDNKVTSVLDILVTGGFLKDDSLVVQLNACKFPGRKLEGEFGCRCVVAYEVDDAL